MKTSKAKRRIFKLIINWVKENNNLPTYADLLNLEISRDMVRHHWGNITQLHEEIKSQKLLFDITSVPSFKKSTKKIFVLTTYVTGLPIHKPFYNALKSFISHYNGELVLLPLLNPKNPFFEPYIASENKFITSPQIYLNDNLKILNILSSPKSVDITTGLQRLSHNSTSLILPSTKLFLRYVPIPGKTIPRAIMSTGCINLPNYNNKDKIFPEKSDVVAHNDHTISAIVVEIENNEFFHFRQLIPDKTGGFADLGKYFSPHGKISKIDGIAVLGDWHVGKTDPILRQATLDLLDQINIKIWVMHDVFDGSSISHHDIGKEGLLAKKAEMGSLSLKQELQQYANELIKLAKNRRLIIVKSNHDEHLERYLIEARYVKHPYNHKLCLTLMQYLLDDLNPLEAYTKSLYGREKTKNITWLKRDESYQYCQIELGAHGDKGANGSRASARQMENNYGSIVYGHTHTPQILRQAWSVGTSTDVKPDYGNGPSSWVQTHCIIYKNGSRQLINFINKKFTTLI